MARRMPSEWTDGVINYQSHYHKIIARDLLRSIARRSVSLHHLRAKIVYRIHGISWSAEWSALSIQVVILRKHVHETGWERFLRLWIHRKQDFYSCSGNESTNSVWSPSAATSTWNIGLIAIEIRSARAWNDRCVHLDLHQSRFLSRQIASDRIIASNDDESSLGTGSCPFLQTR